MVLGVPILKHFRVCCECEHNEDVHVAFWWRFICSFNLVFLFFCRGSDISSLVRDLQRVLNEPAKLEIYEYIR